MTDIDRRLPRWLVFSVGFSLGFFLSTVMVFYKWLPLD